MNRYQAAVNKKYFSRLIASYLFELVIWGTFYACAYHDKSTRWRIFSALFMAAIMTFVIPIPEIAYNWLLRKISRKKR